MDPIKPRLTVAELFRCAEQGLGLTWLAGSDGAERELGSEVVYRPTLALVGHPEMLAKNRVQVLGLSEMHLLENLSSAELTLAVECLFGADNAALFVANERPVPQIFLDFAERYATPLLAARATTAELMRGLTHLLSQAMASYTVLHGVFMEVTGLGVLITGDPAIGKSELALELITRGHRLVADDAVEIHAVSPDTLEGRSPELLRDFMEVRGLGLLNIHQLFGDAAVKYKKALSLIIHLTPADRWETVNRLDMEAYERDILGVTVPEVRLPVAVGRNLAVLVEVAVRNHILRQRGYNGSEEFARRQREMMALRSEDDRSGLDLLTRPENR